FLDEHAVGIGLDGDPDSGGARRLAAGKKFQKALAEAGLAGLTYPEEFGGAGLTKDHERAWREEYAKYPNMTFEFTISHGMCLPMLAEYGTDEQKAEYLADNISGEKLWCQMFSEPGAGSDVASLQTKAERDGDDWVINGQKVWTTLAHVSDYGMIIARTDPTVPKHAGISMFIVPMGAPGVEIRPIHQIDGGRHFNEVFFTDVRIPADNLLGDLNNGWNMATAMLMYERVAIGTGSVGGVRHDRADQLIEEATKRGIIEDPVLRQKLMRLYALETCQSLVSMRTRAELQAGKTPGPGGSLGKLQGTLIMDYVREVSMEIVGAGGVAWEGDAGGSWARNALTTLQGGIAGGTNEIQKNIIGDRVLGLPRDISVDKGVPFNQLLVGTQKKTE
ncbi:MAG: dehydrogenase, partial [Actinobacteria bacterium]|nr:dehydrogenase [Actinomycetota bacterium]NIS31355.1 dehydrogenase [Actinomycetota bacterium]NIT95623.1 dehydrogenase [Actinomycetota bacterium]NIU19316.1 dehydrogenase [Actinomycetota bacterium]NIU66471.1 dehydrogenase [Actinomycetota bacterium]